MSIQEIIERQRVQSTARANLDSAVSARIQLSEELRECHATIRLRVYEARQAGVTIKEIREYLNCSNQRVHQIYNEVASQKAIEAEEADRIAWLTRNIDLDTELAKYSEAIKQGLSKTDPLNPESAKDSKP